MKKRKRQEICTHCRYPVKAMKRGKFSILFKCLCGKTSYRLRTPRYR